MAFCFTPGIDTSCRYVCEDGLEIVSLGMFCMMSKQIQVVEVESHDCFYPLIPSKKLADTEKSCRVTPIDQDLFDNIELVCSKDTKIVYCMPHI